MSFRSSGEQLIPTDLKFLGAHPEEQHQDPPLYRSVPGAEAPSAEFSNHMIQTDHSCRHHPMKGGVVTFGAVSGATAAWWLFEKSELPSLTICCDVLLILIVVRFIWVRLSGLLNMQPRPLPELVLSEEMVSDAAALFRVKVNNMLMIAHDITLGKDFRLFFQVVSVLWLLSVIGNFYSSVTLAYIGTIALVTIPAVYHRHQEHVDRYAGMIHRNISRHYKIIDENVISRLPRRFIGDKDE